MSCTFLSLDSSCCRLEQSIVLIEEDQTGEKGTMKDHGMRNKRLVDAQRSTYTLYIYKYGLTALYTSNIFIYLMFGRAKKGGGTLAGEKRPGV